MDAFQKYLNKMLGVTDEVWETYSPETIAEIREKENKIQAISLKIDELENKLVSLIARIKNIPGADDIQKSINKMMGIWDETFKKHNPTS